MRTVRDRVRHALSFEIIGLVLVTVLGAWAFGLPGHHIGVVAFVGATIATVWNYVYNVAFDRAMLRTRKTVRKTPALRVLHAILFELGLLIALIPVIALYLGLSLVEALVMDAALAAFYVVYAFVFNWAYDLVFPIPRAEPVRRVPAGGAALREA